MSYANDLPETREGLHPSAIDVARIRHNEDLFFLLCSSSFVKSGAHFPAQKLATHFADDHELKVWLDQEWLPQALQHGAELAGYIKTVWPEFDWDNAFEAFCDEYSAACTAEPLERCRGLELAARCVVETGAASRYRALNDMTDEPVLKQLTSDIKSAELRHYKYFHQCYLQYQQRERFGRYKVLRVMLRRIQHIQTKDSGMALRHVFNQCYPQQRDNQMPLHSLKARVQGLLRRHISSGMTAKMLLKPLNFPLRVQAALERPLAKAAERLSVH